MSMDQLKLNEIKDIFRFLKKEGDTNVSFSNKKRQELIQIAEENNLYEIYLEKTNKIKNEQLNLQQLKFEKEQNLRDFNDMTQTIINEDEMNDEDELINEEIVEFKNEMIAYGDYPEIENELNEIENNQEKKEFLLKQKIEDIKPKYYKFGNSMQFSTNRGSSHYIIGKDYELIYCTDNDFGDGALVIPYEITQYTKNAQKCFDFLDNITNIDYIYLRHDDEFVKQNLEGKILKKWNWKIYYDICQKCFNIEFPNKKSKDFNLKTSVKDIQNYEGNSLLKHVRIVNKVKFDRSLNEEEIKGFEPIIPSSWNLEINDGTKTHNSGIIYYSYIGPENQKDLFKDYLNKSYKDKNIDYDIKELSEFTI